MNLNALFNILIFFWVKIIRQSILSIYNLQINVFLTLLPNNSSNLLEHKVICILYPPVSFDLQPRITRIALILFATPAIGIKGFYRFFNSNH